MNELKNKATFEIEGLANETNSKKLSCLTYMKAKLETYSKDALAIETYSNYNATNLLNKARPISFLNRSNKVCVIKSVFYRNNNVMLKWYFVADNIVRTMPLSSFVRIYKKGEFHDVKPAYVASDYLCTVAERIQKINAGIAKCTSTASNAEYLAKKAELMKALGSVANQYDVLEKEAKSMRRVELSVDNIKEEAQKRESKTVMNSLTQDEVKRLLTWVGQNVYCIRVYGLAGGRSGNLLKNQFSDIDGIHYSEVRYNENNEQVSSDSLKGYVHFDTIENAPIDLFEKIANRRHRKYIFGDKSHPTRFSDTDFALYLISTYLEFGFRPGIRHINKQIDMTGLETYLNK